MPLAIYTSAAFINASGVANIAASAQVEVRREDTGALASIFRDVDGLAPEDNPFNADANGRFVFYAAGRHLGYQVKVTKDANVLTQRNQAIGTAAQIDLPAIGADGFLLTPSSGAALWLPPAARADRIINGQIVESHTGNAVTYTLKGKGGVDLSTTNPCFLIFPSATLISGDFDIVKVTANKTVTLSAGSSTGHASGIDQHHFVGALNQAGAAELFATNLPSDYSGTFGSKRLITTTTEGGLGAADSATGIYSDVGRSNVAWIPLAKVRTNQASVGTWAAAPVQIDMAPFDIPRFPFQATKSGAQTITTATVTKLTFGVETFDPDGAFDSVTNYRYQPNIAGYYECHLTGAFGQGIGGGQHAQWGIRKNGVEHIHCLVSGADSAAAEAFAGAAVTGIVLLNGTSDYVDFAVYHEHGSDRTTNDTTRLVVSGKRL